MQRGCRRNQGWRDAGARITNEQAAAVLGIFALLEAAIATTSVGPARDARPAGIARIGAVAARTKHALVRETIVVRATALAVCVALGGNAGLAPEIADEVSAAIV